MFGFRRGRIPFALPALIILAVVVFASIGSAASAIGFTLFLPFFVLKLFFMFFLFGMMFRLIRGGTPWRGAGRRGGWGPPAEPTEEERERAEAMREARREVDSLFPDL